ncbi:MAG: aldo/keto reductase [Gammaproteobacteria bacterium]|nr:aldo/keto reductase [Gammaproteobacteria bacterium]
MFTIDSSRRRFLRIGIGALAAGSLPSRLPAADPLLRSRPIPATGERLPVVGLGTYRSFDVGAENADRVRLRRVLELFAENGGTLVDTSPMYGSAEAVVGDLADRAGITERLFLATKVWTRGRQDGIAQMQRSLALLRRTTIELMQVHNLVDVEIQLATLADWKAQGIVQYVGITHYTGDAFMELEAIMRRYPIDFVQFPYSIANRVAEQRLLAAAAHRGVAVITHRNFEKGRLFKRVQGHALPVWTHEFDCSTWGQFFLKYVLAAPEVNIVIPATGNPKHLLDNLQAARGALPDAAQRRRMVDVIDNL